MKDTAFIRGEIPMTKSEIRAVSLAKLEIHPDSVIYDIGAGTGSISVEAALAAHQGHVYAFEQKEEGLRLIRANADRFGVSNLTAVPGKAPESMSGFPGPDRVFLGGTGGNLEQILDLVYALNPQVRVVVNVIALETLARVMEYYRNRGTEPEVVCLQVSRAQVRGGYHMMQGQNPVYVITAEEPAAAGPEADRPAEDSSVEGQSAAGGKTVSVPRFMIAAPSSGSGKTVITAGLLALFQKKGKTCASFKCGPDYIDPMFHQYVLGIPGCNLDSFFLEEEKLRRLFVKQAEKAELAVLEGVMGYYDGVAGNTLTASSYEIARMTDTPVILVVDGRGSSLSAAAAVHGFMQYRQDSRIAGVILNRTSQAMAERIKPKLEELGIAFLGAVPECPECRLESRHLGLTLPEEQESLREKLEQTAERLEACLDVDKIFAVAAAAGEMGLAEPEMELPEPEVELKESETVVPCPKAKRLAAVARDEAFCFYYQENLEFLRECGWELSFFSPLHERDLPEGAELILLGGGYPEIHARQLSENKPMLEAIQNAAGRGVKILAECGGFLYLHQTLEGDDGVRYPMVGVIAGDGYRTERLGRFGYISLCDRDEGTSGNENIRGHEFHYWDSTAPGTDMTARKPASERTWDCMYVTDRMIAGFPHLYYRSGAEWIRRFLKGATV